MSGEIDPVLSAAEVRAFLNSLDERLKRTERFYKQYHAPGDFMAWAFAIVAVAAAIVMSGSVVAVTVHWAAHTWGLV